MRTRIQHFRLIADPPPDSVLDTDPGFWWPKTVKLFSWKQFIFFISKVAIYLSLGLHKGRPSYKRSFQLTIKKKIQHFKIWNFFTFSTFADHFCHPGSGSSRPKSIQIRIHNTALFYVFVALCLDHVRQNVNLQSVLSISKWEFLCRAGTDVAECWCQHAQAEPQRKVQYS